jgi:hypothetical protein
MSNLISLTVNKDNALVNSGVRVFNTSKIKRVKTQGSGSILNYAEGSDRRSVVYRVQVNESAATVNNSLTGALDFCLSVNIINENGTITTESIKTSDILLGFADPVNSNYCYLDMADTSLNKKRLKLNNTIASIIVAANNYSLASAIDATPTSGSSNSVQSGGVYTALQGVSSTDVYIDNNRVDSYVANGTISKPYTSISSAVTAYSASTTPLMFHIAPGTYTENADVSFPNVSIIIYGNNATILNSGHTITIQNPNYARYNLFTTSNVVFNNFSAGARCLVQGGGITGDITVNSYCEFTQCQLTGGTVTVGSTGQLVVMLCTPTSKFVSTGLLTFDKVNLNTGYAGYLITSTAGQVTIENSIIYNVSTNALAGCISCVNGATTTPNIVVNNFLVTLGSAYGILFGTAVTILSKNYISATNKWSGTGYAGVNSDIITGATMQLGSDAVGDIYYRNASGYLTRLAIGTSGQTLKVSGGLPVWTT